MQRPIEFHLADLQHMRPLHRDNIEHKISFEVKTNSEYELLLCDDKITAFMQPKPELVPDVPIPNLFADNFDPTSSVCTGNIKSEPVDSVNSAVIGQIVTQLPNVAKEIKKEMLDSVAQDVSDKHSSDCALHQYIQSKKSGSGLRIVDIRTLIEADKASQVQIKTEPVDDNDHFESQANTLTTSQAKPTQHMVTSMPIMSSAPLMWSTPLQPLPMVMHQDAPQQSLHMATNILSITSEAMTGETSLPGATTYVMPTLPVVTMASCMSPVSGMYEYTMPTQLTECASHQSLHEVTGPSSEYELPLLMVTAAVQKALTEHDPVKSPLLMVTSGLSVDTEDGSLYKRDPPDDTGTTTTRWSKIANRPVPCDTEKSQMHFKSTDVITLQSQNNQPVFPTPVSTTTNTDDVTNESPSTTENTPSPAANGQTTASEDKMTAADLVTPNATQDTATTIEYSDTSKHCIYYNVLSPEEDEIVSISHDDIMSNVCEVSLERLSSTDLEEIQATLKGTDTSTDLSDVLDSKPKIKPSHRPLKRPSKECLHAQRIISERNEKI